MDHAKKAQDNDQPGPKNKPWRWRERAVEWLDFPLGLFLDFGCGWCGLLERVQDRCQECHGIDVDKKTLEEARNQYPDFQLAMMEVMGETPYPDNHFDTIASIEVIEHVTDERATLCELARILKPGGKLLLTTPHRGWFTFLDLGNFKFVFPRVHRFIHRTILRQSDYYEHRFRKTTERSLVGDISLREGRKPWHRHFKREQIEKFCPESLSLIRSQVYFPGMRAFMLLCVIIQVISLGSFRKIPWPLSALEYRLSQVASTKGDQLVMLFEKKQPLSSR